MPEVALVRRPRSVLDMTPEQYERLNDGCAALVQGGSCFLPKGFLTIQQAKAGAILAISYGYDPFLALQWMWPVEGRLTFHYRWKLAMAKDRVPTLDYGLTEHTLLVCRGWIQRKPGATRHEVEYVIDQAKLAGLLKTGGAWEKSPKEMLFSKWIDRALVLAAPDVILGPPSGEEAEVLEDEATNDGSGATVVENAAEVAAQALGITVEGKVEDAGKSSGSVAVVDTAPVTAPVERATNVPSGNEGAAPAKVPDPPHPPKPDAPLEGEPTAKDLQKAFMATAKSLGFNTKSGERMSALLSELLVGPDGTKPTFNSPAELTRADWAVSRHRLIARYPDGAPKPAPTAPAAAVQEDVAQGAAEAPAAVPETSAATPEPVDEAVIQQAQTRDPNYLLTISLELEKVWKQDHAVVKQFVQEGDPQGYWWFINGRILRACRFVTPDGKGTSAMCLGKAPKSPERWLTPEGVAMLSNEVLRELQEARNGGRPVVAQTS